MIKLLRCTVSGLAAAALALSPLVVSAQSRSAAVSAPAVVVAQADTNAANPVTLGTGCTPAPGYPCVTPTPLPPGAGNSCFRGNSAGVSRCNR